MAIIEMNLLSHALLRCVPVKVILPADKWNPDGTLMPANRAFRKVLEDNGFNVTWHEAPGGHDWDFWNEEMQRVLDWLPLGEGLEGPNSGNVR